MQRLLYHFNTLNTEEAIDAIHLISMGFSLSEILENSKLINGTGLYFNGANANARILHSDYLNFEDFLKIDFNILYLNAGTLIEKNETFKIVINSSDYLEFSIYNASSYVTLTSNRKITKDFLTRITIYYDSIYMYF
jgi:hypothetical protein